MDLWINYCLSAQWLTLLMYWNNTLSGVYSSTLHSRGFFPHPSRSTFFLTFDKSHCDMRQSSSTFGPTCYVKKQSYKSMLCWILVWCSLETHWYDCIFVKNVVKPQSIYIFQKLRDLSIRLNDSTKCKIFEIGLKHT